MASKKITQLSGSNFPPLSGETIIVYSGQTYKTTLSTLKNLLVESGSHSFLGNQTILGNLNVNGSLTAQDYIISSSQIYLNVETISGSSNFGNTFDDNHNFTGSVYITNSLNVIGTTKTSQLLVGTGSLKTGSNSEILHVENVNSQNIASFNATKNSYAQVNITNKSSHPFASTDLSLTADNGNEIVHYVNMGINSSNYSLGFVGQENDAYVINVGKDLYVGTIGGAPTHLSKLKLFSMNTWQNPQITIDNTTNLNLVSFNTGSVMSGYTYEFSGSAMFDHDVYVKGKINCVNGITGSLYGTALNSISSSYITGLGTFATTGSNIFIGDQIISGNIVGDKFSVNSLNIAPVSISSSGVLGEIRITSDFIYVCNNTDSWVRSPLNTW
jgi:hypothetical protein